MKNINLLFLFCIIVLTGNLNAQNRYLEEIFDKVIVTNDIHYATNVTIISNPPAPQNLLMDIYEPAGDDVTQRPVIIMFHSGNFLPYPINMSTSGTRRDSTLVGIARRLAKMGYVVASASYRLGWNPLAPTQPERVNLLINAAYRGVQDANTAIRFLRKTIEEDGNPYSIDEDRITLWGIGTGGYITLNAAVLDEYEQTLIPKFIGQDNMGNPVPMVLQQLSGDPKGIEQGAINIPNHVTYSSDFHLSVNMGGAMGDISWLREGDIPMISFHVPTDPYAPYEQDVVIVPGANLPVVEVQGSYLVQQKSNDLGNNNAFVNANFNDVYTQAANEKNDDYEGLYPFIRPIGMENNSAPWDWWSSENVHHQDGLEDNPDMSFAKAMTFADTILGYFAPRAYVALDLEALVSSKETVLPSSDVRIMPNPAFSSALISSVALTPIREVLIADMNGRIISAYKNIDNQYFNIPRDGKPSGMYLVQVKMDEGIVVKKLIFN